MTKEVTKTNNNLESAIIEIVKRKDIDPDRLEKFLNLQVRMEERQNKAEFHSSLALFQKDCPVIKRTSKVDFKSKSGSTTKYDFAPLDEIVHIIKPILSKCGLSYSFNIEKTADEKSNMLVTTIYHTSGHEKEFTYFFKPLHDDTRMNESQRAKSAVTYAKRAALENALGIVTAGEDDDARRAIDKMITTEQLETILKTSENTETAPEALLKYLKVTSLNDLTFAEANNAINMLNQKRKILVNKNKEVVK